MGTETTFLTADSGGHALLPRLLRTVGAAVVVASLSLFLFQGWDGGNDLDRYLLLLLQTLILAVTGYVCGRWLHEGKGARTFLTLAVVAVPINFAILGAFIYSLWGVSAADELPGVVTWRALDIAGLLAVGAIGMPTLAVVSLLGFSVVARRSSGQLTALFLGVNAALLLPDREPQLIAALVVLTTGILLFALTRLSKIDAALHTTEGRIARALLFIAPAILIARNVWLHSCDTLLFAAISLSVYLILRAFAHPKGAHPWRRWLLPLMPAGAAATELGIGIVAADIPGAPASLFLSLSAVVFASLLIESSVMMGARAAGHRRLACTIATSALLLDLALFGDVLTALLLLTAGLATVAYGFLVQNRYLLGLGMIAAVTGLVYQVRELVGYFDFTGWGGLALLGMAAIVSASLVERHGERFRLAAHRWRERMTSEYVL